MADITKSRADKIVASFVLGTELLSLAVDQKEWSEKTFGSYMERGPVGPLKHIMKECQEAVDDPTDIEEYADILILWLDSVWRAGFGLLPVIKAAQKKMEVNKTRKFSAPTADEPMEHVRDGSNPPA